MAFFEDINPPVDIYAKGSATVKAQDNMNRNINNFLQGMNSKIPGKSEFLNAKKKIKDAYGKGGTLSAMGIGLREAPKVYVNTIRDIALPKSTRGPLKSLASGTAEVIKTALTGEVNSKPLNQLTVPANQRTVVSNPNEGIKKDFISPTGDTKVSYGIPGQTGAGSITVHNSPTGKIQSGRLGENSPYKFEGSAEDAKKFFAPVGRGATFAERGFGPSLGKPPEAKQQNTPLRELFTKENSDMGWKTRKDLNKQILANEGNLNVQNTRNLGSLTEQKLRDKTAITTEGMRTQNLRDITDANQGIEQNKTKLKNEQDMKKSNIQRLKDKNTLLQNRISDIGNFIGTPEELIALQIEAAKAATEYERALGSGTRGAGNSQTQKYL